MQVQFDQSNPTCQSTVYRDALINRYRGYALQLVKRFERALGLPPEQRDEFVAAGYMGLVEAAGRYEPSTGTDFRSYAYLRIRGAVIDALRSNSELSGSAYRYARALSSVNDLREIQLSEPERSSVERIIEYAAQGALAYRLAFEDYETEASEWHQEDVLNPEEELERRGAYKRLRAAVDRLPEKERRIVQEYYFSGKSFVEIGQGESSMSKSWVSRLHRRALQNLKNLYEEESDAN